jgi:hypothetical protein
MMTRLRSEWLAVRRAIAAYRDSKQETRRHAEFQHALYLSSPALKQWLAEFKARIQAKRP